MSDKKCEWQGCKKPIYKWIAQRDLCKHHYEVEKIRVDRITKQLDDMLESFGKGDNQ